MDREFAGGPVVRTQRFHCWGLGIIAYWESRLLQVAGAVRTSKQKLAMDRLTFSRYPQSFQARWETEEATMSFLRARKQKGHSRWQVQWWSLPSAPPSWSASSWGPQGCLRLWWRWSGSRARGTVIVSPRETTRRQPFLNPPPRPLPGVNMTIYTSFFPPASGRPTFPQKRSTWNCSPVVTTTVSP